MPTTRAANSWPMPCAQPPTATMAMAQPSTETPALRLLNGSPKPLNPVGFVGSMLDFCKAGDANKRHAATCGRRACGKTRAARTVWKSAMAVLAREVWHQLALHECSDM